MPAFYSWQGSGAYIQAILIVSSLAGAADAYSKHRPSRVISLLSEEEAAPKFPGLDPARHLLLYVDRESCAETINKAARERSRQIIDFVRSWDGAGDLLVHCNRGVSRSTAAAFIILCMKEPQASEAALMKRLRTLTEGCIATGLAAPPEGEDRRWLCAASSRIRTFRKYGTTAAPIRTSS